jgi:hypothetical protein
MKKIDSNNINRIINKMKSMLNEKELGVKVILVVQGMTQIVLKNFRSMLT